MPAREGGLKNSNVTLEVVCLGTGVGHSHVYQGICSSSYVVVLDKKPILLIGLGGGVVKQCLEMFGCVPDTIFIPNNRSHWASDLAALLPVEAEHGRRLTIVGEMLVMYRLQQYRLAELIEAMKETHRRMDHIAKWVPLVDPSTVATTTSTTTTSTASTNKKTPNDQVKEDMNLLDLDDEAKKKLDAVDSSSSGNKKQQIKGQSTEDTFFELVPGIFLSLVGPARSAERSFGLKVSVGEFFSSSTVLFSISADSPFDTDYYKKLDSPVVFVDAQNRATHEHAGFDQIQVFSTSLKRSAEEPGPVFVVGQYGSASPPAPATHSEGALQHVTEGSTVTVFPNMSSLKPEAHGKVRTILLETSKMIVVPPRVRMNALGNLEIDPTFHHQQQQFHTDKNGGHRDPKNENFAPTVPIGRWGSNGSKGQNASGHSALNRSLSGSSPSRRSPGASARGSNLLTSTPKRQASSNNNSTDTAPQFQESSPPRDEESLERKKSSNANLRLASSATRAWASRLLDKNSSSSHGSDNKQQQERRRSSSRRASSRTGREASPAGSSRQKVVGDTHRWEPKRVYIYSNEDKTMREKLIMVQSLSNVDQLRQLCSTKLDILPVGEMVLIRENLVVESLEHVKNDAMMVVTKHGGANYNVKELPIAAQRRLELDPEEFRRLKSTPIEPGTVPGMPSSNPNPVPDNRRKTAVRTPSRTKSYPKGSPFGPSSF